MSTIMNPNYDLFVQIIFMWWIFKVFINLFGGLTQTKLLYPVKAGIIEIISGVIGLIVIIVCLI